MNNLIWNSKGLGSQKCLAFPKVGSFLYKGCRGISVVESRKGHRVSSFISFVLFLDDRAVRSEKFQFYGKRVKS